MKYSIIIPTYDNTEFIVECLKSVITSFSDIDYELLVGIDDCYATMKMIPYLKSMDNSKIYRSTSNVGPYVLKNSLVDQSVGDHLIFFDSDDVMHKDFGKAYDRLAKSEDFIRFKFYNFKKTIKHHFPADKNPAEGVFGMSRKCFDILECFKPWRCAADSEFSARAEGRGITYKVLDIIAFYRRLHNNNLTVKSDTGIHSDLRLSYSEMINDMKCSRDFSNPESVKVELVQL